MTCQEIRAHFQGDHFAAVNPLCESAAFSEHVAKCGECNRFIEEQKELAKYFLLLRESTPATSAPLDASVLAAYRLYIAERPHRGAVFSASQIGTLGAFRWAAAIAFALIVGGAVLLLISGHQSRVDQVSTERPRVILPAGVANAKDRAAEPGSVLQKPNSTVRSTKHASHAIPVGLPEDWSSSGFQELMYCDQLSCPEAMDVIRVQLPSAAVGFGPTTSKASDFVYADVLVGPDGIARGIRVLE